MRESNSLLERELDLQFGMGSRLCLWLVPLIWGKVTTAFPCSPFVRWVSTQSWLVCFQQEHFHWNPNVAYIDFDLVFFWQYRPFWVRRNWNLILLGRKQWFQLNAFSVKIFQSFLGLFQCKNKICFLTLKVFQKHFYHPSVISNSMSFVNCFEIFEWTVIYKNYYLNGVR